MRKIPSNQIFDYIKQLAEVRAPSGMEDERADEFIKIMKPFAKKGEISKDKWGNVVIRFPMSPPSGENPPEEKIDPVKILLVGHLDEIGGTVFKIKQNGRLLLQPRGGFESRWIISQKVSILSHDGKWIQGLVLGRTIHAVPHNERITPLPQIHELEIFIGAYSPQEVKDLGIHVGAPIVFAGGTEYLNLEISNNLILSNSLDNIISLAVFLELAARLSDGETPIQAEIIMVAAVREEIGREGSLLAAQALKPDICIGIDFGIVESDPRTIRSDAHLQGGPMIVWSEGSGRGIFDYKLAKRMMEVAESEGLRYQNGVFMYYGSDAGVIQSNLGVPSLLIAPPMLAGHNVPEVMALSEIYHCVDLLDAWLRQGNYR